MTYKANDELQELWNRGQITEYALKIQSQYEKVVEQNRALQAELREKTAECKQLMCLNRTVDKSYLQLREEAERYKQALDEIRELITDNDAYVTEEILYIINKAKEMVSGQND